MRRGKKRKRSFRGPFHGKKELKAKKICKEAGRGKHSFPEGKGITKEPKECAQI